MLMTYRYTDNDLIEAVRTSLSLSEVLKKLGLKQAGGNFLHLKKKIAKLDLDTSHFKGQNWSKDLFLKDYACYVKPEFLKKRLLAERGHICEVCFLSNWRGEKVPLELHHIDCNRLNNNPENIQLLCCNCHALTEGYRGRKPK